MKVGIVIAPYEEKNASGIAHCILNQAAGLIKKDTENEYLLYTSTPIAPHRLEGSARNIVVPSSFIGKNVWFLSMYLLRRKDMLPDVLLFNMPLLPLVLPSSIKTIPIYYELQAYGEAFGGVYEQVRRLAVKRAVRIITPSDGPRKDIIEHFEVEPEKVVRIYLGFQDLKAYAGKSSVYGTYRDHFLFVGKVKFKKNVHNILEGFILFKKKHPNSPHKLVLAGDYGGEYHALLQKSIAEERITEKVVFLGYMVKEDLYTLYVHAGALMFCTLQEGFGMPIIEAMDLGVPVITSNRAPMDEVGGEAAFIVDPESPKEIAQAMETAIFDEDKRSEAIRRGKERAKLFSWEKHTSELLDIIRSLTDSK